MRLLVICACAALAYAGVDPNARTDAGKQESTLIKTGAGGSFTASQSGSRDNGNFNGKTVGSAAVEGSSGLKASAVDEEKITAQSGSSSSNVDKTGTGYTAKNGGKQANYAIVAGAKPADKRAQLDGNGKKATADLIPKGGENYDGEFKDASGTLIGDFEKVGDTVKVQHRNTPFATVDQIQNKEHIKITQGGGQRSVGSKFNSRTGKTDNFHVPLGNPNSFLAPGLMQKASLNEAGSSTSIDNGIFNSVNADVKEGQKSADLSGRLAVLTVKANTEYEDAVDEDCQNNAYSDRRDPAKKNQKWKFSEPDFKIFWDDIKVDIDTDKSGNQLSVGWPKCATVTTPIKFPAGTDLKKIALGLTLYFPGCPGFVCAGRTCGKEQDAKNGFPKAETCFTTNLCELQMAQGDKKKDLFGNFLGNSETDACTLGSNGGKLLITNKVCQYQPNQEEDKACPLLSFRKDPVASKYNIAGIGRVYELRAGQQHTSLGASCSLRNYYIEGCRKYAIDYKINAFGLNGDDKKYTGIDRSAKVVEVDGGGSASGGASVGGGSSGGAEPTSTTTKSPWGWFGGNNNNNRNPFSWNRGGK